MFCTSADIIFERLRCAEKDPLVRHCPDVCSSSTVNVTCHLVQRILQDKISI